MIQKHNERGFTILELMLAMTFLTALLLVIAVSVIQISRLYNKGLVMSSVNDAGRDVSDDIKRTLASSTNFDPSVDFVRQSHPGSGADEYAGGRLCTGSYTYIWNLGTSLNSPVNTYTIGSDLSRQIRLAKVMDQGGMLCRDQSIQLDSAQAIDLLSDDDNELSVYSFDIKLLDTGVSGGAIYRVSFELGTDNPDSIDTSDASCRAPNDDLSDREYCAINRFDLIVNVN